MMVLCHFCTFEDDALADLGIGSVGLPTRELLRYTEFSSVLDTKRLYGFDKVLEAERGRRVGGLRAVR